MFSGDRMQHEFGFYEQDVNNIDHVIEALKALVMRLFNFVLPKLNTDYIRQAEVMNTDNLRLIRLFKSIL